MNQNLETIFEDAAATYRDLQDAITRRLEQCEVETPAFWLDAPEDLGPARFREDAWQGDAAGAMSLQGGGRTRVLEGGRVLEKGGVNFSDVRGTFSEELARNLPGESREFRAAGISLVLHPRNPFAPTVHANFRVIRRGPPERVERMWFGGGADLTPHYLFESDARHFHGVYKAACDRHTAVADYARMKADCDQYFSIPHRGEARGIGGIFYDYRDEHHADLLRFSADAGGRFLDSYVPILEQRAGLPYTPAERAFQLWKRGRYVEFNLVYDRGTAFGLRTGGRIESILMSLPPLVTWQYDFQPAPGSPEEKVMAVLRRPQEWV